MIRKTIIKIKNLIEKSIYYYYKRSIPRKIKEIRKKNRIKVLFVLADLSKWKTETLYLEMLKHNRFEPILGITLKTDDKPSESARKLTQLIEYLQGKKYHYVELIREGYIKEYIKPDIIIYQEPYLLTILRGHNYLNNLYCLFISITYGFHSVLLPFNNIGGLKDIAWFDCYENDSTAKDALEYIKNKRKNICVTGLPMSEVLLNDQVSKDVWRNKSPKKRIIWAPHHSIGFNYETITYGNFLAIADDMRKLAEKYKDKIHWAFKPHPLLKYKLELIWGAEKTEEYYSYWRNNNHTQLEEGDYVDLFKLSDAMIHDCDTFTIEYLYMNKPVMFVDNKDCKKEHLNSFAQKAMEVHYHGNNINDIEEFIHNVIISNDVLKAKRNEFFSENIDIPLARNASKNIIDRIIAD